eukprot:Skav231342  [mRNA]  locus=scaffold2490:174304:182013:- [translate_table: standard]
MTGSSSSVTLVEQTVPWRENVAVFNGDEGKYINVALLNHTVVVLFEDSLKFYLSLYGHRLPVMTLDISDDSQIIASGSADKNISPMDPGGRAAGSWAKKSLRQRRALEHSVRKLLAVSEGSQRISDAGRADGLKLWDCDSYELITSLAGHACEILAMALSQDRMGDAAFIVTAGNDKQIRIWKRTQEQLFLSEERAKEKLGRGALYR